MTIFQKQVKRPYSQRIRPGRTGSISSRITDDANRLLSALATSRGISKSEYICRILNDHLRSSSGWRVPR
jgi:hypothetical protein